MSERLEKLLKKVRPLDEREKIIGSFLIQRAPFYDYLQIPSKEIEGWVGLEVPIRYLNELKTYEVVWLNCDDAIASYLVQRGDEAADWFEDYRNKCQSPGNIHIPFYFFEERDGRAALDSTVSTDAYYKYLQSKRQ